MLEAEQQGALPEEDTEWEPSLSAAVWAVVVLVAVAGSAAGLLALLAALRSPTRLPAADLRRATFAFRRTSMPIILRSLCGKASFLRSFGC